MRESKWYQHYRRRYSTKNTSGRTRSVLLKRRRCLAEPRLLCNLGNMPRARSDRFAPLSSLIFICTADRSPNRISLVLRVPLAGNTPLGGRDCVSDDFLINVLTK